MALTPAQLAAFASDIENNTNQTIIDALAAGNNNAITAWYNEQASPDYYLWRNEMTVAEMKDQHFDWGEVVAQLTTNELLALQVLTDQEAVDPSRASIREAFSTIFAGPQTVNTRTALINAAKRLATNVQKLAANTSDGDGTVGSPAVATVEAVSLQDVRDAVALIGG